MGAGIQFRITILPHSPFPPVLHFQITFLFHFRLGLEEEITVCTGPLKHSA